MENKFEAPEMEIIRFETEDVIVASGTGQGGGNDELN